MDSRVACVRNEKTFCWIVSICGLYSRMPMYSNFIQMYRILIQEPYTGTLYRNLIQIHLYSILRRLAARTWPLAKHVMSTQPNYSGNCKDFQVRSCNFEPNA